jgi:formate-dependent nitrite reductase membrane component NrfD
MSEPVLDNLLHLALFIGAIGFVGVVAVAVLERVAGSGNTVIRRTHIVVAVAVLVLLVVAERVYHLVT